MSLASIEQHYRAVIEEHFPISIDYIYDVETAMYFVKAYIQEYHSSLAMGEVELTQEQNIQILTYIENMMTYLAYNSTYMQDIFEEGYQTTMYAYFTEGKSLPLAEEDYTEIFITQEYLDFYNRVFRMNPIDAFIGESGEVTYSQLAIFMSYMAQYVVEEEAVVKLSPKEFEKMYIADIEQFVKEWLTHYVVYDKKKFKEHVIHNEKLIQNTYHVYNTYVEDEQFSENERVLAKEQLYLAIEQLIKEHNIVSASKLVSEDFEIFYTEIDDFLRNNDLGLTTPEEIINAFTKEYRTLPKIFMQDEVEEREAYITELFKDYLQTVLSELQFLTENGILTGEVNESGVVSQPTTPTIEQLVAGLYVYERENQVFVNLTDIEHNTDPELQVLLENTANTPVQIKQIAEILGEYAEQHTITFDALLATADIESYYDEHFMNVSEHLHSFESFLKFVQANKKAIIIHYRNNHKSVTSLSTILNQMLVLYDNTISQHIQYENSSVYIYALEEVFNKNSLFGITVDRDAMRQFLKVDASVKRDIQEIFEEYEDETQITDELIMFLHGYVPQFTTNKRYTILDRHLLTQALTTSTSEHKPEPYTKLLRDLQKIIAEKETLNYKTSYLEKESYIQNLANYVHAFFERNLPVVEYFDLPEEDREIVKEEYINNPSELSKVEDNFEKWMYFSLQHFYFTEKEQMRSYDTKSVESAIDLNKMREIHAYLTEQKDVLSNEQKLHLVSNYIHEIAKPYEKPLQLDDDDWEIIDIILTIGVNKLNPYSRFAINTFTKEKLLQEISGAQLLELKATCKTRKEFEQKLRTIVNNYIESQSKVVEKNKKRLSVPLSPEEFPYKEKLESLSTYIVRYVEQGSDLTPMMITRNHEVIQLYASMDSAYIVEDYTDISTYVNEQSSVKESEEENTAYVLNIVTGEFCLVNFNNMVEYDRVKRVHGWLEFPIESDAWYKIAFMSVPPKRFCPRNATTRLAKTKINNSLRRRKLYEATRKRELILLRNQQLADKELDEYIIQQEKKEEEERLLRLEQEKLENHLNEEKIKETVADKEDTTGQSLAQNLKETLKIIEETKEYYEMTSYRKQLFSSIISYIDKWKKQSDVEGQEETQKIKGIVVDKENYIVKLTIGTSVFLISPYFILNGSYCITIADYNKRIILPPRIDESDISSFHQKAIAELAKVILKKPSLTIDKIVNNTMTDVKRLMRLKKIIRLHALNDENLIIKDNIDGTAQSHIVIKVRQSQNGNEQPKKGIPKVLTYIFAPSVVFLQETSTFIYQRKEADGFFHTELYSLWGEHLLGGQLNKKKLFSLFSTMDLRRSI